VAVLAVGVSGCFTGLDITVFNAFGFQAAGYRGERARWYGDTTECGLGRRIHGKKIHNDVSARARRISVHIGDMQMRAHACICEGTSTRFSDAGKCSCGGACAGRDLVLLQPRGLGIALFRSKSMLDRGIDGRRAGVKEEYNAGDGPFLWAPLDCLRSRDCDAVGVGRADDLEKHFERVGALDAARGRLRALGIENETALLGPFRDGGGAAGSDFVDLDSLRVLVEGLLDVGDGGVRLHLDDAFVVARVECVEDADAIDGQERGSSLAVARLFDHRDGNARLGREAEPAANLQSRTPEHVHTVRAGVELYGEDAVARGIERRVVSETLREDESIEDGDEIINIQ
jgi:hypothetical protein